MNRSSAVVLTKAALEYIEGAIAPHVGQSWDSVEGKKTIVKIDGDRVFVEIKGRRSQLIIQLGELASEIDFDERQFASRQKSKKKVEEEEDKKRAAKEKHEDTNGFAEQFSPMRRTKIINTLNKSIRYKGAYLKVRELVEKLATDGYDVTEHARFKRVAQLGDEYGPFLTQRDLTKTGLDYLKYLRDKK